MPQPKAEKYRPPIGVRIRNWVALAIFLYSLARTVNSPTWLLEDARVWYLMLVIFAAWMMSMVLLYPTIAVSKQELRLYYPWGTYKTIPWQFVIAIRASEPATFSLNKYAESFIAIEAHTLNPIYALLGKLFDRGGRLVLIFRYQAGYDGLINDFEDYAPHALAKELKE